MNLIEILKSFERPIEITPEAVDFAFNKLSEEQKQAIKLRYIDGDGELHDNKDRARVGKLMNTTYAWVRVHEIKGLRKMLDLIPQYYFTKDNVIDYLKEHTKDETISHFKVTKKAFNQFIKDNNIEIIYERRTAITKGLIPCKHAVSKLIGKKREKYNSGLQINKEKESVIRNDLKKEYEFKLGCLLAQNADIVEQINLLVQKINYQKSLLDCLYKCDYVSYIEEEAFGCHTKTEEIKNILNDRIVLGYIAERCGIQQAICINNILNGAQGQI